MVKLFYLLLLNGSLLSLTALGQKNYAPGYVVLTSGDTLRGQVMDRRETFIGTELLTKIRLKPEGGGLRRKYRAKKLLAYRTNDNIYERHQLRSKGVSLLDAYYEIVPNDGEPVFLRVVSRGKLSHYQWEWVDEDNDHIDAADYFRKADELLLVRATQGVFGLKRKNLTEYFQDCPSLQEKIQQRAFKYPSEVADYYNQNCR